MLKVVAVMVMLVTVEVVAVAVVILVVVKRFVVVLGGDGTNLYVHYRRRCTTASLRHLPSVVSHVMFTSECKSFMFCWSTVDMS